MDEPIGNLTIDYIRRIYSNYGQGMFFGLETESNLGDDFVTWREYR